VHWRVYHVISAGGVDVLMHCVMTVSGSVQSDAVHRAYVVYTSVKLDRLNFATHHSDVLSTLVISYPVTELKDVQGY